MKCRPDSPSEAPSRVRDKVCGVVGDEEMTVTNRTQQLFSPGGRSVTCIDIFWKLSRNRNASREGTVRSAAVKDQTSESFIFSQLLGMKSVSESGSEIPLTSR